MTLAEIERRLLESRMAGATDDTVVEVDGAPSKDMELYYFDTRDGNPEGKTIKLFCGL